MFKLFYASLFSVLLLSNTFAQDGGSLKQIVDELNYSLTVEWDQKDPHFYKQQVSKFESEMLSAGYTKGDIINVIKLESSTSLIANELDLISLHLESNNLSESEAMSKIIQLISKNYAQGASWNGRTVIGVGAVVIIAAIAVGVSIKLIGDKKYQNGFNDGYGKDYDRGFHDGFNP